MYGISEPNSSLPFIQEVSLYMSSRDCVLYLLPMSSINLSTAFLFPPALRHASAAALALALNPSSSCPDCTSLAITAPNSTASIPGATFLFPYMPIPRYSAQTAISYVSLHCGRIICGNPALEERHVRTKESGGGASDLLTGLLQSTNLPHHDESRQQRSDAS